MIFNCHNSHWCSCFILRMLLLTVAPETAPSNFEAVATSPYTATLSWDPLPTSEQNGVITGYIINVTIVETGEKLQLISVSTSLIVTTLRPFRTYICIITAQTAIGIGPFSGEFTLITPQDGKFIKIGSKRKHCFDKPAVLFFLCSTFSTSPVTCIVDHHFCQFRSLMGSP